MARSNPIPPWMRDQLVHAIRSNAHYVSELVGPVELAHWTDADLLELGQKLVDLNKWLQDRALDEIASVQ